MVEGFTIRDLAIDKGFREGFVSFLRICSKLVRSFCSIAMEIEYKLKNLNITNHYKVKNKFKNLNTH